jgi:hypothetical protein
MAPFIGQQIENDQHRRILRCQLAHAALGRMNAQQQFVERHAALDGDHDFAVEHESLCPQFRQCPDDVRKVALQRLPGLRLQLDLIAVAERQTTEAVPLGLVAPALAGRNLIDGERLHRFQRRFQFKRHASQREQSPYQC